LSTGAEELIQTQLKSIMKNLNKPTN